jgi:hypothetical protein
VGYFEVVKPDTLRSTELHYQHVCVCVEEIAQLSYLVQVSFLYQIHILRSSPPEIPFAQVMSTQR